MNRAILIIVYLSSLIDYVALSFEKISISIYRLKKKASVENPLEKKSNWWIQRAFKKNILFMGFGENRRREKTT